MGNTESHGSTATKLARISALSRSDGSIKFNCLMHLYNEKSLRECFDELDGRKAIGLDGVNKDQYKENLGTNLSDLIARMKRMAYKPGAVRQVLIPKEGKPGATRPLGISNIEDKIVQGMTRKVLESIYEPLFLGCSYGFRPEMGCHTAIKALEGYLYRNNVQTVIDVDLENYFGTIDHKILEGFLREKITDEKFIRYIIRMFKAGVLANGELSVGESGVPQGSICSPALSNIMAHHVIDEWFEETVKAHCKGKVSMYRYADDLVICCQYDTDAQRIKVALGNRLAKYNLKMNNEKTKLVRFDKRALGAGAEQESFDFLGFTFSLGKSLRGFVIPKLKTNRKRMVAKLKKVNQWAKSVRNKFKMKVIWKSFCCKMQGHIAYYGVSFNLRLVKEFVFQATQILFKWLNRRSQRKSFSWEKFNLFLLKFPLPMIKVYAPLS